MFKLLVICAVFCSVVSGLSTENLVAASASSNVYYDSSCVTVDGTSGCTARVYPQNGETPEIVLNGFDAKLPADDIVITGIQVNVNYSMQVPSFGIVLDALYLVDSTGEAFVGEYTESEYSFADSNMLEGQPVELAVFGNSSYSWGRAWTAEELSDFSVAFRVRKTNDVSNGFCFYIYNFSVKVFYEHEESSAYAMAPWALLSVLAAVVAMLA